MNPKHAYNSKGYRIKLAKKWQGKKNPNYGGLSEERKR